MSALTDRLGRLLARAHLARARALGTTVRFSHRGGAAVTLYAEIPEDGVVRELTGDGPHQAEERRLRLDVPTGQDGFAHPEGEEEPVTPGDTVEHANRTYFIRACPRVRAFGYVYTLHCVERKRLASGAR